MMTNSQRRRFVDRDETILCSLAMAGDFPEERPERMAPREVEFPAGNEPRRLVMDVGPYSVPVFPLAGRIRWR